jgi:FtsP/CotA-like multicopper oxidase with cupredoxin domain
MMATSIPRRGFLGKLSTALAIPAVAAALTKGRELFGSGIALADENTPAGQPMSGAYVPVVTPGIQTLPYELDGDVKVFRLRAEPVTIRFQDMSDPSGARTRPINAWGYNGSVIGPTIEAVEGDRVRIHVENRLPDATTVHWHGLHIPINMDGVAGISQEPIMPGESFTYEFTLNQHGTYFYHPHYMGAKQVGMGMAGFFIIHPKNPTPAQIVDRDFAYFLQIWMINPSTPQPDIMEMSNFNYFTMNGKPSPGIVPMAARIGEKVRIRIVNLSMLTHPVHLHGHTYRVSEYGAGFIPPEQQIIANTINVSSAEERTLEFTAGPNPGTWVFHCHFMHHVMNDMHRNPIPGGGGGGHAGHDAGGMHTWIEVT